MRILITGGSGLIGRALCTALDARGDGLTVFTRDPARARARLPAGTRLVGSLADIAADARFDAICNLAGESIAGRRWTAARRAELLASRVGVTGSLATLVARLATPPAVLLSASAVGIYGTRAVGGTAADHTEASPLADDGSFSHALCVRWEAAARALGEASGCRVVLLRLGVVLSPDGGMLAQLLPVFRLGLGGRVGSGSQWLSYVHRADAVAAMLHLLADATATGAWNLTAPEPVTQARFAHALARRLHRPALLPLPAPLVRAAFGQMGEELLLGGQRALPARLLAAGFTHAFGDVDAALADLLP